MIRTGLEGRGRRGVAELSEGMRLLVECMRWATEYIVLGQKDEETRPKRVKEAEKSTV